ncbi:MAG: methyl-accepting chemotaxis protein, partial [Bacteroidia bacterium]
MRFTIGKRIALGFGVIVVLTAISFLFTNLTLNSSRVKISHVTEVVNPSLAKLKELDNLLNVSKIGITVWYYTEKSDIPEKTDLPILLKNKYPVIKSEILKYSENWAPEDQASMKKIITSIDDLFEQYQYSVMDKLQQMEDYHDPAVFFLLTEDFEFNIRQSFNDIKTQLGKLIDKQNASANTNNEEMLDSFDNLEKVVLSIGILLVLGSILIAFFTVRSIVNPIQQLKKMLLLMGKGVLPAERIKDRKDEIGEMSVALNDLIDGMERTTEFAKQVGSGNFDSDYRPLSNEDTLSAALLK